MNPGNPVESVESQQWPQTTDDRVTKEGEDDQKFSRQLSHSVSLREGEKRRKLDDEAMVEQSLCVESASTPRTEGLTSARKDDAKDAEDAEEDRGRSRSRLPFSSVSPPPIVPSSSWHAERTASQSPPSQFYHDDGKPPNLDSKYIYDPQWCRATYEYECISESDIRLLRISPGQMSDEIHCALKVAPMEKIKSSMLEFQALSYAWGTEEPEHVIYLHDISKSASGKSADKETNEVVDLAKPLPFFIRKNLFQALEAIRHKNLNTWVWVDALCINQENNHEKSSQLPKMLDIYSNAWNVIVWLGGMRCSYPGQSMSQYQDGQLAIDLIPKILNLREFDDTLKRETADWHTSSSWASFASLLLRPWFSRRWVIQEVASANKLSVRIGDKVLSWLDFTDAVELFWDRLGRMEELYNSSTFGNLHPDDLSSVRQSAAMRIIALSRNVFRKAPNSDVVVKLLNLRTLVLAAAPFAVSNPLDVVYALLSLANDFDIGTTGKDSSHHHVLSPNYSEALRNVCCKFVEYCISTSGSLDIICHHWVALPARLSCIARLPSWVSTRRQSTRITFHKSVDAEHLGRISSPPIYDASNKATVSGTIRNLQDQAPAKEFRLPKGRFGWTRLPTQGIKLGTLHTVSTRVIESKISQDCLQMLGWEGTLENGIQDCLWRTLVANRSPEGKIAPSWYRRACALALTKTGPEGDLNLMRLTGNGSQPSTMIEFLKRVQNVLLGRKIFLWKANQDNKALLDALQFHESEMVGLGPEHMKEGDLLYILFGCSVPVAVRKLHRNSPVASLIGECYVHGCMEGEVFVGKSDQEIDEATEALTLK